MLYLFMLLISNAFLNASCPFLFLPAWFYHSVEVGILILVSLVVFNSICKLIMLSEWWSIWLMVKLFLILLFFVSFLLGLLAHANWLWDHSFNHLSSQSDVLMMELKLILDHNMLVLWTLTCLLQMSGRTFLLGSAVMKMQQKQNCLIVLAISLNFVFGPLTEDRHWQELVNVYSSLMFSLSTSAVSWQLKVMLKWVFIKTDTPLHHHHHHKHTHSRIFFFYTHWILVSLNSKNGLVWFPCHFNS